MTVATLKTHKNQRDPGSHRHQLWLLPPGKTLPDDLPGLDQWQAVLARRQVKPVDLAKSPQALDLPDGTRMALVRVDVAKPRFERLTVLRKAVALLLDEHPKSLAVVAADANGGALQDAAYVALVNGAPLPVRKKKTEPALEELHLYGTGADEDFSLTAALARANTLTRALTFLPPNELGPTEYRKRVRTMAKEQGWEVEEYDYARLKKMGAGAFCAVAQGSGGAENDDEGGGAAIVHLRYEPKGKGSGKNLRRIALVGKGICFDTGGHNLKPARYMQHMHEDMNGSAVVLGILQAATELRLPMVVDAWLAIAHNHISPKAFKQNDILTALDGTTIEVVHTDAEGRLVLADTLTLASRGEGKEGKTAGKKQPDLIVDFATLTGSMHAALGTQYSGVFASEDALALAAVSAGKASGERVCVFPMDEDYEEGLESKVADIKQCSMEGDADHILAARFLKRFTNERPWIHVDLSAVSHEGGLGAVSSKLTGFGVAWGMALLKDWMR